MGVLNLSSEDRALVSAVMSRRRLLQGAAAGSVAVSLFGFTKTKEIHAQQLMGNSLYDQLGGLVGITAVINTFVGNVVGDARINAFFTGLPADRVARLKELLIQQIAAASGGPVTYTGGDMKSVHAGMGITMDHFNALVEDL